MSLRSRSLPILHALIALLVAFVLAGCSSEPIESPATVPVPGTERLDRGVVAVAQQQGVYLSWRFLDTDDANGSFDVYRGPELVATVADSTNYLDEDSTLVDGT